MDDPTRERRLRHAAGLRGLLLLSARPEAGERNGYLLTAGDLGVGVEGASLDEYFLSLDDVEELLAPD